MFQLEKLLALAGLARSMYGRWVLQQLLSRAIVVAALIMVSAIMVSVMLVGGFYAAYQALLISGYTPLDAFVIIGGAMAFLTMILIYRTMDAVRKLREMPKLLVKEKAPISMRAGEVVDSFVDGLLAR